MKITTYILSLILSGFVYLLFAAYMTGSAGLNSVFPLMSFYSSLLIFGFLSWFHFFKPRSGAILLTIFTLVMFFSWPALLLAEYFNAEYQPSLIESAIPFTLSALTITFVWKAENKRDLNKYAKLGLGIPPLLLALYIGGYFTYRTLDDKTTYNTSYKSCRQS